MSKLDFQTKMKGVFFVYIIPDNGRFTLVIK